MRSDDIVSQALGQKVSQALGQPARVDENQRRLAPLYLVAWLGLITTLIGIGFGIQTLYNFATGNAVSGFTTVILLLIFFAGIILTAIGTVAIYLAKVLQEVKSRPTYIIRRTPHREEKKFKV